MSNSVAGRQKVKHSYHVAQRSPPTETDPRERKIYVCTKPHTGTLPAVLFIMARKQKQRRCPHEAAGTCDPFTQRTVIWQHPGGKA